VPTPSAARTRHDPYAAIRIPNYRAFAGGFSLSSTGLQMLAMAIGWEVYDRTHSEMALGLTGLCRALPVVLLALPAGHAADVFSRKWIVVAGQAGFAISTAALGVWSYYDGPLWMVYALLVVTGCVRAFAGPARAALVPLIVPKDVFQNAVAWNTGFFHASGVLGPLIAGAIIHQVHAAWPVYVCTAVLTAIMAVSATMITPLYPQRPAGKFTLSSMMNGLGYVRKERTVFGAILIDCLGVLLGGATALLPVFASDILHVGPSGLGALRASTYVGAVLMAVYLTHRPPFIRAGRAFLTSVILWAVCAILFGLSTSFWLSLVLLGAQGAIDNISVVIRHVLVQVRTPDELRGRVSAVNTMFIEVSNELGAFESGGASWLYRAITGATISAGAVFSVVSGGIGTLLVVAAVAWKIPELRRLGALREEEPVAPPAPASANDA